MTRASPALPRRNPQGFAPGRPRKPLRRVRAGLTPLALAAALAGCGPGLPSGNVLVHQVASSMGRVQGYRITGSSHAGQTTTSFRLLVQRNGDFQGTLDIAVPHSKTFRSDVIAVGGKVYVRSPTELQELGISSLPGNLDPATTWVLQPKTVASSYRHSVLPFSGSGLARTLTKALAGPLRVSRSRIGGRRVFVVQERGGRSSLRLFVAPASDHLLELAITGDQPVSLRYSAFGLDQMVASPPGAQVYVPPAQAAPG